MTRRVPPMHRRTGPVCALLAVAACGSPAPTGAPVPAPAEGERAPAPVLPLPIPGGGIHLATGSQRYVVHYQRRVEQEIAGQEPTLMSYRAFISAAITPEDDSGRSRVTHVVDSIVPDSGSFVPPTVNFAVARGLRLTGRLAANGSVRDVTSSDTLQARFVAQFLGNLRDFYPRMPIEGLTPSSAWTDTTTNTERSGDSEVVLRAVLRHTTTGWAERDGRRSLRVAGEGTYTVLGTGEQAGQPFELVGSGTRRTLDFVSPEGLYLGGEARDSASLSVTLPAQGMTVPIRQTLRAITTVLP